MKRVIQKIFSNKRSYAKIIGIESSCDETGIAIMEDKKIISESLFSHYSIVKEWQGVHPIHTSNSHFRVIEDVLEKCLQEGKVNSIEEVDGIAVTLGPGLIPCLKVGFSFAKSLSDKYQKPLIPINHIEAHIMSVFIEYEVKFPFLALVISGGHTLLVSVEGLGNYTLISQSLDDTIGEAFDKTARLLGLPVEQGGKALEKHAIGGLPNYRVPVPLTNNKRSKSLMFSFSGIKSDIKSIITDNHRDGKLEESVSRDIAFSFQQSATFHLANKLREALIQYPDRFTSVVVVGGVASNQFIRNQLLKVTQHFRLDLKFPSIKYCTDNGTMIANVGVMRYSVKDFVKDYSKVDVLSKWPIESIKERNF